MTIQPISVTDTAVRRELPGDSGVEIVGRCVSRLLVHVNLGRAYENEPVFVEVVDRGEHKTSDRYLCWAFSCHGFPLQCSMPSASLDEALEHLSWDDIKAKLSVGCR